MAMEKPLNGEILLRLETQLEVETDVTRRC